MFNIKVGRTSKIVRKEKPVAAVILTTLAGRSRALAAELSKHTPPPKYPVTVDWCLDMVPAATM
jgi:hypothetical protein